MNRRGWQAGVTEHWDEMRPKLKGGAQDLSPFAVCFSSGIQPLPYLSHSLYRDVLHNACHLGGQLDLASKSLSFSSSVVWWMRGVSLYVCCVHVCAHKVEATERECGKNGERNRFERMRVWHRGSEVTARTQQQSDLLPIYSSLTHGRFLLFWKSDLFYVGTYFWFSSIGKTRHSIYRHMGEKSDLNK